MFLYVLLALSLVLVAWPLSRVLFPATHRELQSGVPAKPSVLTVGCSMSEAAHVRAQLLACMDASGLAIERMTLQPHVMPEQTMMTVRFSEASPQALARVAEALASTPGVHQVNARLR